jgi:hypothetical protein
MLKGINSSKTSLSPEKALRERWVDVLAVASADPRSTPNLLRLLLVEAAKRGLDPKAVWDEVSREKKAADKLVPAWEDVKP